MSHTRKTPSSSGGRSAPTLGVVSRAVFYRQGLIRSLNEYPCLSTVDLGSGGEAILRGAQQKSPEVIIVDLAWSAPHVEVHELPLPYAQS